jgi:hypothetical protein
MLDLHAINGTPGAATVLGANFATVAPGGDGASVAGVPIAPGAILRIWGGLTIAANTIGALRLQSQDQPDPINGEHYLPGAASLMNELIKYTNLPYKSGVRSISMGTNTGVDAATAYTMDELSGGVGQTIDGALAEKMVIPSALTFGGALTVGQWGQLAFAPAQAIPNGKYAILGALVSAMSYGGLIRFKHNNFGRASPGFPVSNYETISTSSWDKIEKDTLLVGESGYQFVHLSKVLGRAQCPVFEVTNAGTGLVIECLSRVADTPVVSLLLAKVG